MNTYDDTPEPLAERQEDRATQDDEYDPIDPYAEFWNRRDPLDPPMFGPGSGRDMDGVPTI